MDLREMGSPFEKKYVQFTKEDITKIANTLHSWQQSDFPAIYKDEPEFCYSAAFDEIAEKDYSLVPSKYIEFVNRDENFDFDEKMKDLQKEFSELLQEEEKTKQDLLRVLKELGYEIKL